MDQVLVKITEQCLGCGTHAKTLLKRLQPTMCHPCHLRRKALDMIFFLLQQTLGNEHRHVYIFHTGLLKTAVKLLLDILPDRIARGLDDHTALDR